MNILVFLSCMLVGPIVCCIIWLYVEYSSHKHMFNHGISNYTHKIEFDKCDGFNTTVCIFNALFSQFCLNYPDIKKSGILKIDKLWDESLIIRSQGTPCDYIYFHADIIEFAGVRILLQPIDYFKFLFWSKAMLQLVCTTDIPDILLGNFMYNHISFINKLILEWNFNNYGYLYKKKIEKGEKNEIPNVQ